MQLFIQECIMCFCFGKNEYVDGQRRHIPHFPASRIWEDKSDLWETTCGKVYKGILDQKMEDGSIKNRGVELIRFIDEEKDSEESIDISVNLKELLENMY